VRTASPLPSPQPSPIHTTYLLKAYQSWNPTLILSLVSQVAVIAIAFGLIATFISVIGVFLNYLTLRVIVPQNRKSYFFPTGPAWNSLIYFSYVFFCVAFLLTRAENKVDESISENVPPPRLLEYGSIQYHQHTHVHSPHAVCRTNTRDCLHMRRELEKSSVKE